MAGLILIIIARVTSSGSFTPLALLGLIMAIAGIAMFVIKLKEEKAYAKYLEQELNRPKSMAEKLAQQQAETVDAEQLHKEPRDTAIAQKSHVGLGMLKIPHKTAIGGKGQHQHAHPHAGRHPLRPQIPG